MKKFFFIKLFIINLIFLFNFEFAYADNTYFIDFTKVLNQSIAGAEAQEKLKKKLESDTVNFKKEEDIIKKQEQDLISQKKILSGEEYKKKLDDLRNKVSEFQKKQQTSLSSIASSRIQAKNELLKAVNPIIKKYMEDNNIRLVVDKQSVILGDTTLEITDKIITILNEKIKSINFN